jgi:hypothetical protein
MHLLAVRIFPLFLGPRDLLPFLNWLTVACASLSLLPFYALIRPHLGHRIAIACLVLWMLAPIVWEAGTFYHPLIPAMFLLLLALVLARRIARTGRGGIAFVLVALLSSVAFLVRVEICFVWPGLLAWTLTSRRRWRDTGILLCVSIMVGITYLLESRGVASSGASPTAMGFVKSTSGLYTSAFNLRGLPRSMTWMILGVGVMTLAACVAGILKKPAGNSRLLTAALCWSVPSIIFWLPQPTPINRHYLLATMGIVVVLGILVLSRLTGRRLVAAILTIGAFNLAVPDVAYRLYNAAHTGGPKTAHGSFFYFHSTAARQIEKDAHDAQRISTCAISGMTESAPRSCALVRWEEFAHVAYELSVSGRRVIPEPVATVFPGVRDVRFKVDDGEVRAIVYSYFEDQNLRERVSGILQESQRDGFCLFAPNELLARVPELQTFGRAIQSY